MDDGRLENEIRPKRRSGGARIALMVAAVVVISAAAVATGTAMTGQQAANGPVQVSVGGGAALTPPIATTPTPVPTTPVTTVPAQTPPTTPPPAGSTKSGGASPGSAPGGSHATTVAKPPAAPPKTAPANTPVTIGGQLTCSSGKSIEGVWVSTTTGSGYAPWQGLGNNVSKYWYTLPTSEPYSVHVGCGGTQADWGVACYGPQVTNPADSFECFDVSGAGGYETCGVK